MTIEERDQAYHALITCDGKGKEAKAEALRRLIEWHRKDAAETHAKWQRPLPSFKSRGVSGVIRI